MPMHGDAVSGPDPNGDAGSEVIIVRGVLVLLDPQAPRQTPVRTCRVLHGSHARKHILLTNEDFS